MKPVIAIVALLAIPLIGVGSSSAYQRPRSAAHLRPQIIEGRVVKIADGDTLTVLDGRNQQHKIRLAGIDAPERRQDFGTRAREALADKVFQKDVKITWREHDRYDRTIGDVYLGTRWINKEMVEEGLAWHYTRYSDSQELATAETAARNSKRGLWSRTDAIAPWDFRHRERANEAEGLPK